MRVIGEGSESACTVDCGGARTVAASELRMLFWLRPIPIAVRSNERQVDTARAIRATSSAR